MKITLTEKSSTPRRTTLNEIPLGSWFTGQLGTRVGLFRRCKDNTTITNSGKTTMAIHIDSDGNLWYYNACEPVYNYRPVADLNIEVIY